MLKKLLCMALMLCMLANIIGFAEMAETEPAAEELELVFESDVDDEEETPAEGEAPAKIEISVEKVETYKGLDDDETSIIDLDGNTVDIDDDSDAPAYVLSGAEFLGAGKSATLTVKQDGKTVKVSTLNWTSDEPTVATVKAGKVTAAKKVEKPTTVTITATSKTDESLSGTVKIAVCPAIKKMDVTAEKKTIDINTNEKIVLGVRVDPVDACATATWKSSNPKIAAVDARTGEVSPVKVGKVTITATNVDGSKKTAKIVLNVVKAVNGFRITGPVEVGAGKSIALGTVFEPIDATNKNVTWSSSDKAIATVSKTGVVKANAKIKERTPVTIMARSMEKDDAIVEYKITVCPVVTAVTVKAEQTFIDVKGSPLKLSTTCAPNGASQSVTYKSSSTKIATVSADGEVTPVKVGKVTITATATDGSKKSGKIVLNVVKAVKGLEITGPDAVVIGKSITLKTACNPADATNKKVTWTSSDPQIATVSTSGVVKANAKLTKAATVTITATSAENKAVTAEKTIAVCPLVKSVTIDDAVKAVALGKNLPLHATCEPNGSMQSVTWKSSSTKIATVDKNGVVTPVKVGRAIITATAADGSKKYGTITIDVVSGVSGLTITGPDKLLMDKSATLNLTCSPEGIGDVNVTWTTSDPTLATVDAGGVVTASKTKAGDVTITATAVENDEIFASHTIKVYAKTERIALTSENNRETLNLTKMETLQLTATNNPESALQGVTWESSDPAVATVDGNGLVTPVKVGSVTITATATDESNKTASIKLRVIDYVNVEKVTISGSETALGGTTVTLTALVEPQDAENKKINWASTDTDIAKVDGDGNVICAAVEKLTTVKITASAADNYMIIDEFILTVTPAVKSITINRGEYFNDDLIDASSADNSMQLSAVCAPSGSSQKVTWTSSNTEIATLNENGVVRVLKGGEVTFTATATDGSGVSASTTVTFVYSVEDIEVMGESTALSGSTVQLTATVTPENATNKNVHWSSSDEAVARVDNSGKVTCAAVTEQKTVTIKAASDEDEDIWDEFVLTINPAVESTGN